MWHSAGETHKRLQGTRSPCTEFNTCVVLTVRIRHHIAGGMKRNHDARAAIPVLCVRVHGVIYNVTRRKN